MMARHIKSVDDVVALAAELEDGPAEAWVALAGTPKKEARADGSSPSAAAITSRR